MFARCLRDRRILYSQCKHAATGMYQNFDNQLDTITLELQSGSDRALDR